MNHTVHIRTLFTQLICESHVIFETNSLISVKGLSGLS